MKIDLFEIPGYSKYLASTEGRVVSKKTGLPVQQKHRKDGYVDVLVSPDIGPKYHLQLEHRMICKAFNGLSDKRCVNHKNGIKKDNRPDNLEWVTHSENIRHSMDVLKNKYGADDFKNPNSKISLDNHRMLNKWFKNKVLETKELAKFFGVCEATVSSHIRNSKRFEIKYGN